MTSAVNGGAGFGRLRRQVHFGVVDTDSTTEVQIFTPPNDFFSKQRSYKSHISFSSLDVSCRKDFYGRDAHYYIENEGGVTTFFFFCRASRTILTTARISARYRFGCYCDIVI